jgi:TP901 family phage tail tape measure protein
VDESRNANVNLTADISQYTQPIAQANVQTNKLTDSVNKLVASLDGITKRAGKKLLIFSAADTAAMVGYTAAAAKYEKQLTTLRAQAALAGKDLGVYKKAINEIARDLPVTGAAVTALVTQINQLGITSSTQATQMARVFTNLAAATGEDIGSLTKGLIELSRQMGTLGSGATGISNFADSLTTVSNQAGVSATAVLNFASAIAPMSRAAGIGQKEVLGISTAFTKAGADGFAAANTFNSMVTDITRQVTNGSPELAKYAAAVGATVDQFKQMDSTERIVQIFEAVTKAGPDAVKLIDRLGYDGIRAAKSIQAVANESGGLRKAIGDSVGAFGSGSTQRGAEAAFDSLDSQMTRFKNNLEQIAATIGTALLPVATQFMEIINSTLDAVNQIAGPLLVVAGAIGGILAPVTAALGGLMTILGPLSTLMLAMTAFRLSPVRAAMQGIKEGAAASQAARFGLPYTPTTSAGKLSAAGSLPVFRQAPYSMGQAIGSRLPTGAPGANPISQAMLAGGIKASDLSRSWYFNPTQQLYANAAMRDPMMRQSSIGDALDKAYKNSGSLMGTMRTAWSNPGTYMMARGGPQAPGYDWGKAKAEASAYSENVLRSGKYTDVDSAMRAAKAEYDSTIAAHKKLAESTLGVKDASKGATRSMGELRSSLAQTARAAVGVPLAAGRMGGSLALQGAGRVGMGALGMVGGMVGGGAGVGAALVTGGALAYGMMKTRDGNVQSIITSETQVNLARINGSIGLATESLGEFTKRVETSARSAGELTTAAKGFALTYAERSLASSKPYNDERVAGLNSPEAAMSFLKSMGELNGEQARALATDLAKKFGASTSKWITDTYSKELAGTNPLAMGMGGVGSGLFGSAMESTSAGPVGFLRQIPGLNPFLGTDTNATEAVQAAWLASIEQTQEVGAKYGPEAEAAKSAANSVALLESAFSLGGSAGARVVQEQSVKQFEAIYGEMGLSVGSQGITSAYLNGQSLNTTEDFVKYATDPTNTSEGAKSFRATLGAAGLGASDLYGPQKKSLDEIAIQMQRGNLSDYEKGVRGTSLGRYARTSQSVLDVTEGTKVGDPEAVGKAINNLYAEMTRGGASFSNVTEQANKLAKAAGSATDPLYQLAMAAKDLAYNRGLTQASQQRGMVGSFQFRMNQNEQALRNPTPDTDVVGLQKERDALEAEGYAAAVAYESTLYEYQKSTLRAREDFHTQMVYAEEDFGKSMRRATEDAAKSMYDPFKRAYNTGTSGLDSVLLNMKRHKELIAEQVKNIELLKQAGFSQQAIDVMDLTNPANAFRVQRFVDGGVTRRQARRANQLAASTQGSSGDLLEQQQGTRRAYEDFETQRERADRGFRKSLDRSAQDLKDYGREIYGNFDDVMDKVQKRMNKVMPGVESDFYKKLMEIGEAITGAPMRDNETARAKNKAGAANRTPGDGNRVYDAETGSWNYTPGEGTTARVKRPKGSTMDLGATGWGVNPAEVPWLTGKDTRDVVKGLRTSGTATPPMGGRGAGAPSSMTYETNYNIQKMSVESRDMRAWEQEVARRTRQRNDRLGANASAGR